MNLNAEPRCGASLGTLAGNEAVVESWTAIDGPPVPVVISSAVWGVLLDAALATEDPQRKPRVFRLFMPRGQPRTVVHATEIAPVWRSERGILRWKEGGYPPTSEPLRKGGNAFVRGDVDLATHDAWWMGREQTDLRILLRREGEGIVFSAWWARAGTAGLRSRQETDGEVMPVLLLRSS
jgi:hypothetical protein